jgi:hypothetical protein
MAATLATRISRSVGLFVLNCALAAFVSGIVISPIRYHQRTFEAFLVESGLVESIIAFGVGYFVYRRWQWSQAKWVWVAGVCWFSQRAVLFWLSQHGPLSAIHGSHSVFWEMSGKGCSFNAESCHDRWDYTLPCLRAIFYSIRSWFCSWFQHEAAALLILKRAAPTR